MLSLVKFSLARPKLILAIFALLTIISVFVIIDRSTIAIDPTKSFSRKLEVIKYYNLISKKFSMKDIILIGVENNKEGVFTVGTVRYVERIMDKLKNLSLKKKYKNIITGKEQEITVPTDISTGDMKSIINADDITVDKKTNTIIIGNLTKKARVLSGLLTPNENEMGNLPKSDNELKRLIPHLKEELRHNKLFRGTIISNNEKACTILVPIEKRLDKKIEILRSELPCMVNDQKLLNRFSGKDYNFPYNIYNKTVAGVTVDDDFINKTVAENKKKLKKFYLEMFSDIQSKYQDFYKYLNEARVDEAYIANVFKMIDNDNLYVIEGVDRTYEDLIDKQYLFTINNLDIFSRNNLEARLYNVKDIYDVGNLYKIMMNITREDKPENIKSYIAGRPIAEALIEEYVINDMTIFLSLTIIVMIIILYVSFRTFVGIFLPLLTSIIAALWVMGAMLLLDIPFSSGTIAMPSIIIALGISDIIYYLSRYYEVTIHFGIRNVKDAILESTDHVWVAVTLSELTCMTAFLSNTTSVVIDISMMSLLVSIGLFLNLIFTFTFVPATLLFIPLPKSRKQSKIEKTAVDMTLKAGRFTYKRSRLVFLSSIAVTAVFAIGLFFLKTESSMTTFFMKNNPIRVADRFINMNLTGTGQMCIIFKMRDKVDLSSPAARNELSQRIGAFLKSYNGFSAQYPEIKKSKKINKYFTTDIAAMKSDLAKNRDEIEKRIGIFGDISNEFYEISTTEKDKADATNNTATDTGETDIDSLSDKISPASKETNKRVISPKDAGIMDIIARIDVKAGGSDKKECIEYINTIRKHLTTERGKEFLGSFNLMADFFQTDIKQPVTLRKIDALEDILKNMKEPEANVGDATVKPVGNIMSITDPLKLIYKVFYHENNDAYDKIPDVRADGIQDKSITDRNVIGVCMNQLRGSSGEIFKYLLTDDLKLMQFVVFMRSDKADFLKEFNEKFYKISKKLFPENDPYIEKVVISGMPAINMAMNTELYYHHIQSICLTIFVVFLCCLFIFRSVIGALFSIIPLSITVIINMGIMGYFDFPINYATVMNASIAIGAGIDFTIHFLERFKYEHMIMGHDFRTSYYNTLGTKGEAIIISAFAIAGGFAVLMLSTFKMLSMSGLMVALAMLLSSAASIIVLPALLNWLKPEFIERREKFTTTKPLILQYIKNADIVKNATIYVDEKIKADAASEFKRKGKARKSQKSTRSPKSPNNN